MKIDFSKGAWDTKEITYAYSYRFEQTPTFLQYEDCVGNRKCSEAMYGFENISVLSRAPYLPGTKITTHCSFEDLGAPLIVIADKLDTDERGILRFGNYFEIVLYKNGINVWQMRYQDGTVTWKKSMSVDFPLAEHKIHTLSVLISAERLEIEANDRKMSLLVPDLYPSFHVGIDACEGYNRFYDLEIEGPSCSL